MNEVRLIWEVAVVTLSSNDPGWYHRVPVATVALGSNGPPMSMRSLLLWVTDKWVGYETNRKVATVTLCSNGSEWYQLVPVAILSHWQDGWIWNYLTWQVRCKRHTINRGCWKDMFGNMQAVLITVGSNKENDGTTERREINFIYLWSSQ
jgi:hypothetical protein